MGIVFSRLQFHVVGQFAFFAAFGAFVLRFVGQLHMKTRVARREGFGGSAGKGLTSNSTGRPQSTQFPCTTMWLGTGLEEGGHGQI